jgi:hypothetical protein
MKRFKTCLILLGFVLLIVSCGQPSKNKTTDPAGDDTAPDCSEDGECNDLCPSDPDCVTDDDDDTDCSLDGSCPEECADHVTIIVKIGGAVPYGEDVLAIVDDNLAGDDGNFTGAFEAPDSNGDATFTFDNVPPGEYYFYGIQKKDQSATGGPAPGDSSGFYLDTPVVVCATDLTIEFDLELICGSGFSINGTVHGATVDPTAPLVVMVTPADEQPSPSPIHCTASAIDVNGDAEYECPAPLSTGNYDLIAIQFLSGVVGEPGSGDLIGLFDDNPILLCSESVTADVTLYPYDNTSESCTYDVTYPCNATQVSDILVSVTGYNASSPVTITVALFDQPPGTDAAPYAIEELPPDPGEAPVIFTFDPTTATPTYIMALQTENTSGELITGEYFGEVTRTDGANCYEQVYNCGADVSVELVMAEIQADTTPSCACGLP